MRYSFRFCLSNWWSKFDRANRDEDERTITSSVVDLCVNAQRVAFHQIRLITRLFCFSNKHSFVRSHSLLQTWRLIWFLSRGLPRWYGEKRKKVSRSLNWMINDELTHRSLVMLLNKRQQDEAESDLKEERKKMQTGWKNRSTSNENHHWGEEIWLFS